MAGLLNSGRGMALGVGLLSGGNFRNALARGGQNLMAYDEQQRRAALQAEKMGLLRGQDKRQGLLADLKISQMKDATQATKEQAEASQRLRAAAILNGGQLTPEQYAQNAGASFDLGTMQGLAPKPVKPVTLGEGQGLYDPTTGELLTEREKSVNHNQPFYPDGTPNKAYQAFARGKAKDGATNVTVGDDAKTAYAKGLGGEVAKQISSSAESARAAKSSLSTYDQLESAIKNGALTGVAARPTLFVKQVAKALGVEGKNDDEIIANTQSAIQAMARIELEAAQSNKGQGALSDSERVVLRRAAAGDISMQGNSILTLLGALRQSAIDRINAHNELTKSVNVPGVEGVSGVLRVTPPGSGLLAAPQAAPKPAAAPAMPQISVEQVDSMDINELGKMWTGSN